MSAVDLKLPRTIRLDDTDTRVYETAADPGEWAVPGTFKFWDSTPETLTGKSRQAFSHGFLGTASFGWATLVCVTAITEPEVEAVESRLARHLVQFHGAPDEATARPAAREEVAFAQSLCEHPVNTLLAVRREFRDDQLVESFSVFRTPRGAIHESVRLWKVEEEDDGA